MDVVVWLRGLGLEEYEAAFRDNKINEQVLPSLTQEDLKEIGVGPVGHRRILLDAIAAHANTAAPLVGTDTSVYLQAGDGAFACTCIGACTADGRHPYTYAPAATWLHDGMLKADQQLLPRAASAEATVALRLWHWDADGVPAFASRPRRRSPWP